MEVDMNDQKERRQRRFLQKRRAKARARRKAEQWFGIWRWYFAAFRRRNDDSGEWVDDDPRSADVAVGRLYRTPQLCSCAACGNPRRHFRERTRAERLVEQVQREQEDEWFS